MQYTVQFNSELGRKLQEYFNRCDQCNQAAFDFLKTAHKYQFTDTDENTEIIPSDNEAGGLMAIMLAPSKGMGINRLLWAHVTTREGDVAWYPRVHRVPTWMPYAEAVKTTPDVKPCKCADVIRFFTSDDMHRCTRKGDKHPKPDLTVACVFTYEYDKPSEDDDVILPSNFEGTSIFEQAKELAVAWEELPHIRKGTLANILKLRFKKTDDKPNKEQMMNEAKLSWSRDEENKQFVFETGLVSEDSDFVSCL